MATDNDRLSQTVRFRAQAKMIHVESTILGTYGDDRQRFEDTVAEPPGAAARCRKCLKISVLL